jgi:hypothetical protein
MHHHRDMGHQRLVMKNIGIWTLVGLGSYTLCQFSVLIVCVALLGGTGWTWWTLHQHLERGME